MVGVILVVLGAALVVVWELQLVLPGRPWVRGYGHRVNGPWHDQHVCMVPGCGPLLIFWLRPDEKRFYGKVVV